MAAAHNVDSNAHSERERFCVGAGLLFGHDDSPQSVAHMSARPRPSAIRIGAPPDVGVRICRRRPIGWSVVIVRPTIVPGVSVGIAVQWIAITWIVVGVIGLRGCPARDRGEAFARLCSWCVRGKRAGKAKSTADRVCDVRFTPPAVRPRAGRRNRWLQTRRGPSERPNIRGPLFGRGSKKNPRPTACGPRQVRRGHDRSRL